MNAGGAFVVARLFSVLFVVGVEQRRRIHVDVDTDQRMLSGNIRRCHSRTQENLEVTKTHKYAQKKFNLFKFNGEIEVTQIIRKKFPYLYQFVQTRNNLNYMIANLERFFN